MLILLSICAAVSTITLFLYGIDKHRAKKRRFRIRESVLLFFSFLGGSLGALLGMNLFRHKTRHWYFWAVSLLGLIWQLLLALWLSGRLG